MRQPKHRRPPQVHLPGSSQAYRLRTVTIGRIKKLDLVVEAEAPDRWPAISVCMIVKNESDNLESCLRSLGDLPAELIVVDTGSTDKTVEIAEVFGARLHHFPWVNDFAAARNESLGHATGEWVFWLDADDRLDPKTVAQLKRAAADGTADAYMCLVSSLGSDGSRDVGDHVRLFRNRLGIRFSRAIHETVFPDIARLGLTLAWTDIQIEHTGYHSREAIRAKTARNLPILEAQIAQHPEEIDFLFYRGQAHSVLEELNSAESDLEAFLGRSLPSDVFDYRRFWAHEILVRISERRGHLDAMQSHLAAALKEFPGHPAFLLHFARVNLVSGRPEAALGQLRIALAALDHPTNGFRPETSIVKMSLAEAHQLLGQLDLATTWAEAAFRDDPNSDRIATLLSRTHLQCGRIRDAADLLSQRLPSTKDPEMWLVLADLYHRRHRWDEAIGAVEQARQLGLSAERARDLHSRLATARRSHEARVADAPSDPKPHQSRERANGLALLAEGRVEEAATLFGASIQADPTERDNYQYLALALQKMGREEEALQVWQLASASR